jgi:hypothetical protein
LTARWLTHSSTVVCLDENLLKQFNFSLSHTPHALKIIINNNLRKLSTPGKKREEREEKQKSPSDISFERKQTFLTTFLRKLTEGKGN